MFSNENIFKNIAILNVAHCKIHNFKGDGSIKNSLLMKYAIKYRNRSDIRSSHRDSPG